MSEKFDYTNSIAPNTDRSYKDAADNTNGGNLEENAETAEIFKSISIDDSSSNTEENLPTYSAELSDVLMEIDSSAEEKSVISETQSELTDLRYSPEMRQIQVEILTEKLDFNDNETYTEIEAYNDSIASNLSSDNAETIEYDESDIEDDNYDNEDDDEAIDDDDE
jgi:hypothetical protein